MARFEFPTPDFSALVDAARRVDAMDAVTVRWLVREVRRGVRLTPEQRRMLRSLRMTRGAIERMQGAEGA